jgi:hypothetical protein
MPKYQASTAHKTIENIAAERAITLTFSSVPKSTILITVSVTDAPALPDTITPIKLKTADMNIALPTLIHRVVTQVAIAFGASVKPFTNITPRVRSKDVIVNGEAPVKNPVMLTSYLSFFKLYSNK